MARPEFTPKGDVEYVPVEQVTTSHGTHEIGFLHGNPADVVAAGVMAETMGAQLGTPMLVPTEAIPGNGPADSGDSRVSGISHTAWETRKRAEKKGITTLWEPTGMTGSPLAQARRRAATEAQRNN